MRDDRLETSSEVLHNMLLSQIKHLRQLKLKQAEREHQGSQALSQDIQSTEKLIDDLQKKLKLRNPAVELQELLRKYFRSYNELATICDTLNRQSDRFSDLSIDNIQGDTLQQKISNLINRVDKLHGLSELAIVLHRELENIPEAIQRIESLKITFQIEEVKKLVPEANSIHLPLDNRDMEWDSMIASHKEKSENRRNRVAIVASIIVVILGLGIISIDLLWLFPSLSSPQILIDDIMLDAEFHHLGDNTYNTDYVLAIQGDRIENPATEGLSYSITFSLPGLLDDLLMQENDISQIDLLITINHLKPRINSPAIVMLNNSEQGLLNQYVEVEEFVRRPIVFPLNNEHLRFDEPNTLTIRTGYDDYESDYEDFEFNDLGLRIMHTGYNSNSAVKILIIAIQIVVIGLGVWWWQRSNV